MIEGRHVGGGGRLLAQAHVVVVEGHEEVVPRHRAHVTTCKHDKMLDVMMTAVTRDMKKWSHDTVLT